MSELPDINLYVEKIEERIGSKHQLAAFDFANGCLTLTEAGSRKKSLAVPRERD